MCIDAVLDQVSTVDWKIVPIDLMHPNQGNTQQQIEVVEEFLAHPNKNKESFNNIRRKFLRNILETDDGTLLHIFDEYIRPGAPKVQYASTGDIRAYTAQPAWDQIPKPGAHLDEIMAMDGSSLLLQSDMHGYLMNYWQYSFTVPRRPVRFETSEITYATVNPKPESLYGISPFESLVDTVAFLLNAAKYNSRFYDNSAVPVVQIDYPDIKDRNELQQMADWINSNFVGPDKAYRTLVTNGGVKVNTLSFNAEQLQMLQSQQFYLNMCMAKLKVSPAMLGLSGTGGATSSRASMGIQYAVFRQRVLKPLLGVESDAYNLNIIPLILADYGKPLVEFKHFPATDLDEEERRSRINQAKLATGQRVINELRQEEMLSPVSYGYEPFIPSAGLLGGLIPVQYDPRYQMTQPTAKPEMTNLGDKIDMGQSPVAGQEGGRLSSVPQPRPSDSPGFQGGDTTEVGYRYGDRYIGASLKLRDIAKKAQDELMDGGDWNSVYSWSFNEAWKALEPHPERERVIREFMQVIRKLMFISKEE